MDGSRTDRVRAEKWAKNKGISSARLLITGLVIMNAFPSLKLQRAAITRRISFSVKTQTDFLAGRKSTALRSGIHTILTGILIPPQMIRKPS